MKALKERSMLKTFLKRLKRAKSYILICLDDECRCTSRVNAPKIEAEAMLTHMLSKLEPKTKYDVLKNVLYQLLLQDAENVQLENGLDIISKAQSLFCLLNAEFEKGEENNGSETH